MFSDRLPDHLQNVGGLGETEYLTSLVEGREPVKGKLHDLATAAADLANVMEWCCTRMSNVSPLTCTYQAVQQLDNLRSAAADAMFHLWDVYRAWADAVVEVLKGIKVLFTTTDVALKGFAGLANNPAKRL